jgi:caspase domain-containing protein
LALRLSPPALASVAPALLGVLAAAALLFPSPADAAQRFAVIAGNDVGAPGRPHLWYAERDAERFRDTMLELGDFEPDHIVLLKGKGRDALLAALERVERHVVEEKAKGEPTLLVIYYSGHAGPRGLELGADRVSFEEIREATVRSSAAARVVIVDACEAGALTQVKGAQAANVDFALPEHEVQGTAFVASTAVGEVAQESARLQGSFFTHHLDVALRGAGDIDGDGHVTLVEAFQYTAGRTVSATAGTATGPQHPTYDFRMSGRGDVVLAELRRAQARLRVPPDPGATYVLSGPRGLVAEVPGSESGLSLAVPAGRYEVERRSRQGRAQTDVEVSVGEDVTLPQLTPTRYEVARTKGGPLPTEWFAGFGAGSFGMPGAGVAPAARVGFRREVGPLALRAHVDFSIQDANDHGLSYTASRTGVAAAGMLPVFGARQLLEAGVEVGGGWTTQALQDGRRYDTPDATAGLAFVASRPLGRLRLALDAGAGGRLFNLNGQATLRAYGVATVVLLYGK